MNQAVAAFEEAWQVGRVELRRWLEQGGDFAPIERLFTQVLVYNLPLDDIFAKDRIANVSVRRMVDAMAKARAGGIVDPVTLYREASRAWATQAQAAGVVYGDQKRKARRAQQMKRIEQEAPVDEPAQWWWQSSLDKKTCAFCIAMHGTAHPLGEPMVSHPNCRCVPTDAPLRRQGWAWLRSQPSTVQNAILHRAVATRMRAGDLGPEHIVDYAHHRRYPLRTIFGEEQKRVLTRLARRKVTGRNVYRRTTR